MIGAYCCQYHFSQVIKDLKQKGFLLGWTSEDGKTYNCEYPKCKKKAYFEVLKLAKQKRIK